MAFHTKIPGVLFRTSILYEDPELYAFAQATGEKITAPDSGWDTISREYLICGSAATSTADALAALPAPGTPISTEHENMYVMSREITRRKGPVWRGTVTAAGLLATRPGGMRVRIGANSQTQSSSPLVANGSTHPRGNSITPGATVEVDWIFVSTAEGHPPPSCATVGSAPTSVPGVPFPTLGDNPWDPLVEYTYQFPNGWVHTARNAQNVAAGCTALWLVTDVYQHVPAKIP